MHLFLQIILQKCINLFNIVTKLFCVTKVHCKNVLLQKHCVTKVHYALVPTNHITKLYKPIQHCYKNCLSHFNVTKLQSQAQVYVTKFFPLPFALFMKKNHINNIHKQQYTCSNI